MAETENQVIWKSLLQVIPRVLETNSETSLLQVLKILISNCNEYPNFLLPTNYSTESDKRDNNQIKQRKKSIELTCWLLSQLLLIDGTPEVCNLNVNLLVTMLQIISLRDMKIFIKIIQELFHFGELGSSVLFDGKDVSWESFSQVADMSNADPKPRTIVLTDSPQLDTCLTTVVTVLAELGDYLHLHVDRHLDPLWLLIGQFIEAGGDNLRAAALNTTAKLIISCGLPRQDIRKDYLLEGIGATLTTFTAGKLLIDENEKSMFVDSRTVKEETEIGLTMVLESLHQNFENFLSCIIHPFMNTLAEMITDPQLGNNVTGALLKEVLQCYCNLIEMLELPINEGKHADSLKTCVKNNMHIPQVVHIGLCHLVLCDLKEILPQSEIKDNSNKEETSLGNSRKRKFSDTEAASTSVDVMPISSWWSSALQFVSTSLAEWNNEPSNISTIHLEAVTLVINTPRRIMGKLTETQILLQFMSEGWLLTNTEILMNLITTVDPHLVSAFLVILEGIVVVSTVVDGGSCESIRLWHSWVAAATLPWLSQEMNWLDLKPQKAKQLALTAAKLKWTQDPEIKSASIGVLSVVAGNVAPQWRSYIIRAAINERQYPVMKQVATWFPVMVSQLGSIGGQQLVGEVLGGVLHSPDTPTTLAAANSLKNILCSLLGQATLNKHCGNEDAIGLLHCKYCNSHQSVKSSQAQVDRTLVSRFLGLLTHDEVDVVVSVVSGLPAVMKHASLSSAQLQQYLALLEHDNNTVVTAVCQQLHLFFNIKSESVGQTEGEAAVSSEVTGIMTHLQHLMSAAEGENKKSVSRRQLRALEALHYIVKYPLGSMQGSVFNLLFSCLISRTSPIVDAHTQLIIQALAQNLGMQPYNLYMRFSNSCAQVLSKIFQKDKVLELIIHITKVFNWSALVPTKKGKTLSEISVFVNSQIRFLLPVMLIRATASGDAGILVELAACANLRLRHLIIDNFQYILSHLVFNDNEEELENVLKFIGDITELKLNNIKDCSTQQQVHELIMGLHDHRHAVLREFSRMISQDEASNKVKSNTIEEIANFLELKILGILNFLDNKLASTQTMKKEKMSAFWCLSDLLCILGPKKVSPVCHKVLSSLKSFSKVRDQEFYDIGCAAWTNYLTNLDESTLEGLIEEVIVIMMPLMKERPAQVAPILSKILLETPSVRAMLGNIPMLPDHPDLAAINQAITDKQTPIIGCSISDVVLSLSGVIQSLNHESRDVRVHALSRLRRILAHNQDATHYLTTSTDTVHPTISELFSLLLGQCRSGQDEEVQNLVAECLGILGAIDPSRLYTITSIKEELGSVHLSLETESFIMDLVSELSRAFLAARDAATQTCASYALQEVLRYYGIRERGSPGASNVGSAVWDRLPYQIQESLRPLLKSKYMAAQNETPKEEGTKPIYGHKRVTTFHQWLTRWASSLIDLIEGERPKQIFHVCKPIMRRNTSTAMYILPFVLVCVVCESSRQHQRILTEVLAVMSQQQQHQDHDNKAKELEHLAIQTVFSVLDYLSKWSQKQRQVENPSKKVRGTFTPSQELKLITEFLESIPGDLLAQTSFKCQAFSRALLHIEAHLKDKPHQLKDHLKFIQEIYVCLDEPDGVEGVAAIRQEEPTLDEQIIQHEANGRLQDALGCYERICAAGGSEDVYQSMLDCYLNLNQPHSVLNITSGLMANNHQMSNSLVKYGVEAAWQLGKWDQLETFLSSSQTQPSWGVGVGEILLAVRSRNSTEYHKRLCQLREQQITPLSAASMEKWAYQRAYPHILKLHLLSEMEELFSCLLQFNPKSDDTKGKVKVVQGQLSVEGSPVPLSLDLLVERWNKRLAFVQTSQRYLEPLLNFRRTLLSASKEWLLQSGNAELSNEVGCELERLWLQSAKVARKAGHVQQGEWALLGAGVGSEVFLERSKWHWVKGEQHKAVQTLRWGIARVFLNKDKFIADPNAGPQDERIACGKAMQYLARYSEESATQEANTIKQLYADAVKINKRSEDGHFHNAMFFDRVLGTAVSSISNPEYVYQIIHYFALSLKYGCRHIYQSMPRMLGLWLDFGASISEEEKKRKAQSSSQSVQQMEKVREILSKINKQLTGVILNVIPNYMFFTALPQLISRICHSHSEVFAVLSHLIATMLGSFPKQAMWHMIAVSKSSYQMRVSRCLEIFEIAKKMDPNLSKFIADSTKLADKFLELSNKPVEKGIPQISLNNLLRGLPRLISDSNFSSILLPLQQQMTVTLPTASQDLQTHQAFPRAGVYVAGIEDSIEIMQSLILPKKITLRGSDGKQYIFLCKPKDDLRKDCRLMEFNCFVNRCLLHDPESRKRDLRIRTYTVIPLNEECGLLEWVPNLTGFRQILHRLFKDYGVYMTGQELRACMCKIETPLATKRDIFLNKLVPRHPPLMGEWFLRTFPDPQAWLQARLGYCRTTAVMSMVGYILGLGDRHGENILLDASSGDCVHVDFNCLFNKGESFDWPERVPFRLTHNMVAAMGPTGHDGVYRKACEVTMRVMREEREALMSVLRPFIHDPLVEWSRGNKSAKNTGEIKNEKAVSNVNKIENRLSGQNDKKSRGLNLPLSVEGQVNILIEEATSIENLCQMYIGWAAYM